MSDTERRDKLAAYAAVAAMIGFAVSAAWTSLTYDGDLPWEFMLTGQVVVTLPVAGLLGYQSMGDKPWRTELALCLLFLSAMGGSLLGATFGE